MTITDLLKIRPFLYHLTASENLPSILENRELLSVRSILERGNRPDLLRTRRQQHEKIIVAGTHYLLRDQLPLRQGNVNLDDGVEFEEFVELLNTLVFFWPGNDSGPIQMGLNHFLHYADEQPVVLRVAFDALLDANPGVMLKFATVNSGAPRCNPKVGKGIRGLSTFVSLPYFRGTAGEVKEVVFDDRLLLPHSIGVGTIEGKTWVPLSLSFTRPGRGMAG
jgi:hypothetical protein